MAHYLEFKLSPGFEDFLPRDQKGGGTALHIGLHDSKKKKKKLFLQRQRHLFMLAVWNALRDMVERDIETSGRLFLYEDEDSGRICIGVRGLKPIVNQWRAPHIFVASATMPPIEIVSHAFPDCDIEADEAVEVPLPPNTKIVQVINTPHAKHRTVKPQNQRNLRRFIMKHALKHGMPMMLVDDKPSTLAGVQKHVKLAFEKMQPPLPPGIAVRHFNAVSGLNHFKDVGLMISIGKAAPSPFVIEDQIAAITGNEPQRLAEGEWFMKAKGTIKLRDGGEVKVDCYMHPDPLVEAWRRHKHTSNVIQMIGRSRPYNRTAENPLTIYLLSNEPLDIAVDEVWDWEKNKLGTISALVEPMACDGFVVLAPDALHALWPTVFSRRTANREIKELRKLHSKSAEDIKAILATWRRFTVQKLGKGQKPREGFYDPQRFASAESLRTALKRAFGAEFDLTEG
jgi:hypothetical protein